MTHAGDGLVVAAPLSGWVIPLADVGDPAFAAGTLGPGAGIEPDGTVVDVVAPITGTVVALHPHAFAIMTDDDTAVLVHLGIDTVRLGGHGFTVHVAKREILAAGERVVTWDPRVARAAGLSTVCPIVLLDESPRTATARATGRVAAGDVLFRC